MNAIVNDRTTVSLTEAADLVLACPNVRFLLLGEPGIGKSSLERLLGERSGLPTCYVDCANLDLGDAAIPVPVYENKTLDYFINSRFGMHEGKPGILILDEFTKALQPIKNMLHPLLEVHKPRLGSVMSPEGSIIVMTGNLDTDGVGDSLLMHTNMRITRVEVRKPNAREWLLWAAARGIEPVVMAWVDRNPQCLASYRDGDQTGNPYIFIPGQVQSSVVTPRTLELASNIVAKRADFSHNALMAALSGTFGAAAAGSMAAFIQYQDALPKWDDVINNPTRAKLPDSEGAKAVMVFNSIQRMQHRDEMTALLTYFERMDLEWQGIFCVHTVRDPGKQRIAMGCKVFADWCAKNEDIL